jgi:hypothetical protein
MMNILKKIYINQRKINKEIIAFIIFWILCFIPINANPENFNNFGPINQIRLIIPFLLVFFFLLFLLTKKKILIRNFFITIPFVAYIIVTIIFTMINEKLNSYINIYWGIAMLIPYLYIYILDNKLNLLKLFLIFSLILIFFVFFFYLFKIFYEMYSFGRLINFYSIWGLYDDTLKYDLSEPPRSSGLSRMAMLISISCTLFLLVRRKTSFSSKLIIIIIISSTFGLLFHSRTMTFIYFFLNISIAVILMLKKKLKKKIFLFIILLPLFFANSYNLLISYKESLNQNLEEKNLIFKSFENTILRKSEENNFSSHRFENWSKIITASKENYFMGFGFQADRLLIDQSVHNVYLYSLICGGFLSMLLITVISFRGAWTSFLILYKYTFLNKKYDAVDLISTFTIITLLLRGLLETSYAVYSIDYLLFIISFFINEQNYKKITRKKF